MDLTYRGTFIEVDDLALGECTMHRATVASGARWWQLWMRVTRIDGAPDTFVVPMLPGGAFTENGPNGRTWGLTKTSEGWQVSPSVNVLVSRVLHPGEHPTETSIWHETPRIVGVPDDAPWAHGEAP